MFSHPPEAASNTARSPGRPNRWYSSALMISFGDGRSREVGAGLRQGPQGAPDPLGLSPQVHHVGLIGQIAGHPDGIKHRLDHGGIRVALLEHHAQTTELPSIHAFADIHGLNAVPVLGPPYHALQMVAVTDGLPAVSVLGAEIIDAIGVRGCHLDKIPVVPPLEVQRGARQRLGILVVHGPVPPERYRWPIHRLTCQRRLHTLPLGHSRHGSHSFSPAS